MAAGVEIYEYHASFLHAKVAVVDGRWATVGSSNLDPLSLLLAREANVVVEDEAFAQARRFLSYLPSSVHGLPPLTACDDDPERADEKLMKVVPRNRRQVYKMRPIVESVVDQGSFFEMGANFGRSIIAGLARIAREAAMQSRRLWLPRISGPEPCLVVAGRPGAVLADPGGDLNANDPVPVIRGMPYLLFLDADEEFTPALWDEVSKVCAEDEVDGAYVRLDVRVLGHKLTHGEFSNSMVLRLMRPEKARFGRGINGLADVIG